MRLPGAVHRRLLIDPINHLYSGPAFDKSPFRDRHLGLAILATQDQGCPVVARAKRGGDERGVVERGFFVAHLPDAVGALALSRRRRHRPDGIVALEARGVVLDVSTTLERILRLRGGSKANARADDDESGAHG